MFLRIGARLISALGGNYKIKIDKESSKITIKILLPFDIVNDSISITHTEINASPSNRLDDLGTDSLQHDKSFTVMINPPEELEENEVSELRLSDEDSLLRKPIGLGKLISPNIKKGVKTKFICGKEQIIEFMQVADTSEIDSDDNQDGEGPRPFPCHLKISILTIRK